MEAQIRGAIERGELSHLEGEGRPLAPDPNEGLAERWSAAHIVRNAGMTAAWAELRLEVRSRRDALVGRARARARWLAARERELARVPAERILDHVRATADEDARLVAELEEARRELNAAIARHNLHVTGALQLAPLDAATVARLAREAP